MHTTRRAYALTSAQGSIYEYSLTNPDEDAVTAAMLAATAPGGSAATAGGPSSYAAARDIYDALREAYVE